MKKENSLRELVLAGLCALALSARIMAQAGEVVLEDSSLRVAFDTDSGGSLDWKRKLRIGPLSAGRNLALPSGCWRHCPGGAITSSSAGNNTPSRSRRFDRQVRLQWKNLLSEHGGPLAITFTATVTLADGTLTFQAALANDSPLTVETIDWPCFGDFSPPGRDASMAARTMWYGNLGGDEIYPRFSNEKGYWGVDFPTKTIASYRSLFCLIQSGRQGLYVEMADPTQPYLLEYTFEQRPGLASPSSNLVPKADEISGQPVRLEFRTCHFVFAPPHAETKLVPVALRCYRGDWHAGVDLYKKWRATWFKPPDVPDWAKEVHSWAMLRMNTPEEDYTIPYRDFVKYGKEYAANGVRAVQLVGWNVGGQDRNDPSHDTDPKLGTWRNLHDAIAEVQAMGVKVILFGKLNWADLTTDWYANELHKYQATDPYGIPYQQSGYSYVTPTQLAGINNRRRAVMDYLCPAYRAVATREFQKTLALGAAGWLWDENCHHAGAIYSFAPGHGYAPPGFLYSGDVPISAQLREAADRVNPDFLFAGEGQQDWLMQYFPVSETGVSPTPICQYIDPRCLMLAGVSGFDDRETLNLILMYRYVIEYEPYYYKGHLADFPLTLAYGKRIDALRRRYKAYLWDAQFRDTVGASMTADGSSRYSVFLTATGKRAVVVVNQEHQRGISAKVELSSPGKLVVATPERPDARPMETALEIPAHSVAVVMEP